MVHTAEGVTPHDIPARIDCSGSRKSGIGKIDGEELAPALEKAVSDAGGVAIPAPDVAARVDAVCAGEDGSRKIKRGEVAIADQQGMGHAGAGVIRHDVTGTADPV